jgi:hypothetical protein
MQGVGFADGLSGQAIRQSARAAMAMAKKAKGRVSVIMIETP